MINILDIILSQVHTLIQVSEHAKEEATIMTIDEAVRILWDAIQQGDHCPAALQGKLSLDDAYRVQLGTLTRQVETGEQSGWKVAISGAALRQARGLDEPVFGYLLASGHFISGQTLPYDDTLNPAIESELFITVGQRLRGPGVTRDQILEAVAKVEPAFEVVSMRGNMTADMTLGVADNIA
jgi:2-keto-4-pentenoate hydratase